MFELPNLLLLLLLFLLVLSHSVSPIKFIAWAPCSHQTHSPFPLILFAFGSQCCVHTHRRTPAPKLYTLSSFSHWLVSFGCHGLSMISEYVQLSMRRAIVTKNQISFLFWWFHKMRRIYTFVNSVAHSHPSIHPRWQHNTKSNRKWNEREIIWH